MHSSYVLGILLVAAGLALAPATWSAEVQEPLKHALELHEAGKVAEAIKEYDRVLKQHPKLREAYFNRGNAYYDLGSYPQAIKDYNGIMNREAHNS